ncbi:MAG TPA: class I SAM-dependent methyltransferase, partial [Opitutaceae bacterium]|nr:class I SAM-dependent methyltransferase [Opitutaceae bacterium]
MNFRSLLKRYQDHYFALSDAHAQDRAAELAVGGDFHPVGALEYFILKANGLKDDTFVLDVGCGTGRLGHQLAKRQHRQYAGYDIVQSAVDHARKLCAMPDWTFGVTDGVGIALPDASVDLACFFSVFTHIQHEHTFLYLKEMHRLLQPGGVVIFTFLEYKIPSHWTMFEAAVRNFVAEA